MALHARTRWALGAGTLALAGLLAWAFAPRPLPVEVAQASVGAFERVIEEDARTRLQERYALAAPVAGRLLRMALREGDAVEAGAVVARIAPARPALLDARSQREQQARLQAAEAAVQRAQARVERSATALAQAEADRARSEALVRQGFVAGAQAEAAQRSAQAAQADLAAARQDERMARAEREQARAALAWDLEPAGASGARTLLLRAPVAGRVLRVPLASESTVAAGTVVLELGDTGRIEVVAPLLTTEALPLRPGTPVRIDRWGGPAPLEGVVRRVEPGAFTKVSALGVEEQRVPVVVDLLGDASTWQALGDGYRVVTQFLVEQARDALRVPVGALFPARRSAASATSGEGASAPGDLAVFVVREGRAQYTPVQVQSRGTALAWVRSGLQAGDTVVVYPPPALADGMRVQVRTP